MLVIDPRIRQMPRTKKPLQHRSLCCSGFLFQQLSINALKIFRLSLFTRNENSGCRCTAQTNPLSGQAYGLRQSILRDGHSRQPRRKRSHLTVKNKTEKSCATSLSVVLIIPRRAAKCKPYIGGWLPLKRLSVGRVVYLSYSSRSSTVRRTMPMNTLRSSTTGTKFCSMAAFKSVGMSVVTVTAL